jgi:histone-lysine N-methyltransferase SUV39H
VFTLRDVEPYEEICFSYAGVPGDDEDGDEDEEDGEVSVPKNGAVYERCRCGAKNCKGDTFF